MNSAKEFIPGLELSRRFYWEVVRPLLDEHFPGLPHAAARIGPGSEVLGFDTPMSTDHDLGPAVQILLPETESAHVAAIEHCLRSALPSTFSGYPLELNDGPLPLRMAISTVHAFFWQHMAYDPSQPLTVADWLTLPAQRLREMTVGAVHHDGVGELTAIRTRLAWYPHDIWCYLLLCGWQRIGQEDHLMGRAGFAGDELGSALIGSRLARDVMSLAFLLERCYAPYPKWFGTAFQQLACAALLTPLLWRIQLATTWQERSDALNAAGEQLVHLHNNLGLTAFIPPRTASFFDRPYRVLHSDELTTALCAQIQMREVRQLTRRRIGNIDQWSDNTDLRSDPTWRPLLRRLYLGDRE